MLEASIPLVGGWRAGGIRGVQPRFCVRHKSCCRPEAEVPSAGSNQPVSFLLTLSVGPSKAKVETSSISDSGFFSRRSSRRTTRAITLSSSTPTSRPRCIRSPGQRARCWTCAAPPARPTCSSRSTRRPRASPHRTKAAKGELRGQPELAQVGLCQSELRWTQVAQGKSGGCPWLPGTTVRGCMGQAGVWHCSPQLGAGCIPCLHSPTPFYLGIFSLGWCLLPSLLS